MVKRYRKLQVLILLLFPLLQLWSAAEPDYIPLETFDYHGIHYTGDTGAPNFSGRGSVQDNRGFLYFGSWGQGFFRYDGRDWHNYTTENSGLLDDRISHFTYDRDRTIYISHIYTGISALDILTGEIRNVVKLKGIEVFRLAYYNKILYYTTYWKGFYALNTETGKTRYYSVLNHKKAILDAPWNNVGPIFKDSRQRLWGATSQGVFLFDGGGITKYFPGSTPENGNPIQISELPGGELIVFYQRFIAVIDEKNERIRPWKNEIFQSILKKYTLSYFGCFTIDSLGRYNLGTEEGLFIIDPETGKTSHLRKEMLADEKIYSLLKDREHNIWLTAQEGITKVKTSLFFNYQKIGGLNLMTANTTVRDLPHFEDSPPGRVLLNFVKEQKAMELSGFGYREIPIQSLPAAEAIIPIHQETPGKKIIEALKERLSNNIKIGEVWKEKENRIWIAPLNPPGKLFLYKNNILEDYSSHIPSRLLINDLKTGPQGQLYITTDNMGFFILNPQKKKTIQFGKSEGLQNPLLFGGIATDKEKRLFLLGNNTLSIRNDHPIPEPQFDLHFFKAHDLQNQKSIQITSLTECIFPPGSRSIRLYATANSFIAEENLLFRFIPRFKTAQSLPYRYENYIDLHDLTPGEYEIAVEVKDRFGNKAESTLHFTILPLWHEQFLVRIVLFILTILILTGIFRILLKWRTGQLQKQSLLLEKQVKERTAQLVQTRNHLIKSANLAGKAEVAVQFFHNIGNISNTISINASHARDLLKKSKCKGLLQVGEVYRKNQNRLQEFMNEPKSRKLLEYCALLGDSWKKEEATLDERLTKIQDKMTEISLFIASQEKYTKGVTHFEEIPINQYIDDAQKTFTDQHKEVRFLNLFSTAKEYLIPGDPSRVFHILLSIYSWILAKIENLPPNKRVIKTNVETKNKVIVRITATGFTLKEKELQKIFHQTFETPQEDSVLSLHTCANFMSEMKGRLTVEKGDYETFFILTWR